MRGRSIQARSKGMLYRGANSRIMKQPTLSDVRTVLEGIKAQGGNVWAPNTFHYAYLDGATLTLPPVGWYPRHYIFPDIGQDPGHPFMDTTDVQRVYAYCKMAKDMGMRVVLKPMID